MQVSTGAFRCKIFEQVELWQDNGFLIMVTVTKHVESVLVLQELNWGILGRAGDFQNTDSRSQARLNKFRFLLVASCFLLPWPRS